MPRRRITRALLPVVLALGLLAGCDSAEQPQAPPPDGATLVGRAAQKLPDMGPTKFTFTVSGRIPGFRIRSASGVADPAGRARGTVDVQQDREHTEYDFTLRDGSVRLDDGEGAPKSKPVPEDFLPGTLLSSDTGIGALLREATKLRTETTETLHGVETFRVSGKLDKAALAKFIPGVWADATVKFWVAKGSGHQLQRVWIQLPPRRPNAGVVAFQLALSKPAEPVRPTPSSSAHRPSD